MPDKNDRLVRNIQVCVLFVLIGQAIIIGLFVAVLLGTGPMQEQTGEMLEITRDMNHTTSRSMAGMADVLDIVKKERVPSAFADFLRAATPLIQKVNHAEISELLKSTTAVMKKLPSRIEELEPGAIHAILVSVKNLTAEAERVMRKLDGGSGFKITV